jgi:hypothetical protein
MTLATWTAALLLMIAHVSRGEPYHAHSERLGHVAEGIAIAVDQAVMTGALPGTERRLWAAAAVATAFHESSLARSVHAGERLGDGGRSICFMQINRGNPGSYMPPRSKSPAIFLIEGARVQKIDHWRELAGVGREASARCAAAGVLSLVRMRAYCAKRVPAAELLPATLSAYMHGSSCHITPQGLSRARLAVELLRSDPRIRGRASHRGSS